MRFVFVLGWRLGWMVPTALGILKRQNGLSHAALRWNASPFRKQLEELKRYR